MDDDQESGGHQETTEIGEGKLLIKLKIPQVKEEEEGQMFESSSPPPPPPQEKDKIITRVCDVCNKGFSSGKALGGHMRIHVHAKKELKTNQHKQPIAKKIKQEEEKHDNYLIDDNNTINGSSSTSVMMSNSSSVPTCSICDKKFPSMKSLFGHMRCHPERPYRGIQPRTSAAADPKTSPSSSVSDSLPRKLDNDYDDDHDDQIADTVTDLKQSLPRWSVTDRRGRKALTAASAVSSSSEEEEEEEEMRDAVEDLMMLAHGNSLESGLTHKHVVEEFEATNGNSGEKNWVSESKKRRIMETKPVGYMRDNDVKTSCLMPKTVDKSKGKAVFGTGFVQESMNYRLSNTDWHHQADEYDYKNFTDYESDSQGTDGSFLSAQNMDYKCDPAIVLKNKKRTKKMNLRDLESSVQDTTPLDHQRQKTVMTTPAADKYKCSTCNKCFPTHQALGGHRSSHNKFKNTTIQESLSPVGEDANPNAQFDEGAASSMLVLESTLHRCKICNKTFPTGQALGGHKRCHWTAPVEAPAPAPAQVTSPGEASQTGRKVLEFDLNELPEMEFEGGVESDYYHGAGYCYPSSSYNSFA
ncbi:uncharacterized protein LOC132309912 [Cornus florida]|uniref:uncharacterized protein LOC132309912 n=1 Tax=Cornus florida TaxID=4283 RepID=UPI00289BC26B|nr:uncharacterized protein LOC132309912 [Cornus florida]